MASLTETTDYDNFDPECYMKTHDWSVIGEEEEKSIMQFNVDAMHDIFDSDTIKGHNLLDIGTGPTIRTVVSACRLVDEIYLSDINRQNRNILTDWWKGDRAMESELTNYILIKENARHSTEERQLMMKTKIRGILPIDVRTGHPVGKGDHPSQFDVITTCLCFEAASQTAEQYHKVVQNVASLLKVGGHLVVMGLFNNTHYEVGRFKFMCVSLSQDDIENIYKTCGFRIINTTRRILVGNENWTPSTCSESFAMHAVKIT